MDYTPLTELEAVNAMLEIINESPVNSLETTIPEVEIAKNLLHRVSREVQSIGLHCNSEEDYFLPTDLTGQVNLPPNVLSIRSSTDDLTMRGQRLYDRENHTYSFPDDGVTVDIVFFLPFEELPEHVRAYVTVMAARRYQARMLVDTNIHTMTEADETQARAVFKAAEVRLANKNFLARTSSQPSYRRRYA